MNRFVDNPCGRPLTEVKRRILIEAIRDIVRRVMQCRQSKFPLAEHIWKIADRISVDTSGGSGAKENALLDEVCRLILERMVSGFTYVDVRLVETIEFQRDLTEVVRDVAN